ncbi:MAG: hypothetical protein AB1638_04865 [Nitrospirota bacterium]
MFADNFQVAFNRIKNDLKRDIFIALMGTLICTLAFGFYPSSIKVLYWHLEEIQFFVLYCGFAIYMLWKEEKEMTGLHSDFDLIRKDP